MVEHAWECGQRLWKAQGWFLFLCQLFSSGATSQATFESNLLFEGLTHRHYLYQTTYSNDHLTKSTKRLVIYTYHITVAV